ncbi:MAG: hypothetical protein FWG72_04560 [Oscillospiraceae bacterium]|nr:hypothetical protein [Oscillospiraceae bacterium]
MNYQIAKRLKEIERQYGTAMTLIVKIDEKHREMTVTEFEQSSDARFVRVKSGSCLKDLDRILDRLLGGCVI